MLIDVCQLCRNEPNSTKFHQIPPRLSCFGLGQDGVLYIIIPNMATIMELCGNTWKYYHSVLSLLKKDFSTPNILKQCVYIYNHSVLLQEIFSFDQIERHTTFVFLAPLDGIQHQRSCMTLGRFMTINMVLADNYPVSISYHGMIHYKYHCCWMICDK